MVSDICKHSFIRLCGLRALYWLLCACAAFYGLRSRLYSPLWSLFTFSGVLVTVSGAFIFGCDTLLAFRRCRGCISLLMRCASAWCPCLRSVLVSVLTDDGFIFCSDRLKSPLYGLLESALAFQCSGMGADGLSLRPRWRFNFSLFGCVCLFWSAQGLRPLFRAVWSRSSGRCFINPCRSLGRKEALSSVPGLPCLRLWSALNFPAWSRSLSPSATIPALFRIVFLTNFCINDWF